MRLSSTKITAGLLGLTLAAAAGCGSTGDKAGGEGGVKTLRLGTTDPPGRLGSKQAERFASEVQRRSGGRLRIKIVWRANVEAAGGFKPGWDQTLAALVRDGELELGVVPARAWDTLGVTTLQALQAPFLITTPELTQKIVRSPASRQMLDGLGKAGVVGLGLLPEEIRHPVSFGRPLRNLADFKGRQLRVPRSDASFELMRALGARPVDLDGLQFGTAVSSGRVTGAESALSLATTLPRRGTVSANVSFYPKVTTLVADEDAFDRLSGDDRDTLREAARATLEYALPSEAQAAATACRQGVGVAAATQADLAELEAAARPVYADLQRDPRTRALIERFREMKTETRVSGARVAGCAARPGGDARVRNADTPAKRAASISDGTYRKKVSQQEFLRDGISEDLAFENHGVQTLVIKDGRFTFVTKNESNVPTCHGAITASGRRVALFLDPPPDCGDSDNSHPFFTAAWTLTGGELHFTRLEGTIPEVETAFAGRAWRKIR
jgi:TRAP-type C4-dicarboxylate transport system substrate-binding protein